MTLVLLELGDNLIGTGKVVRLMMQFTYFQPRSDIARYVSSYYDVKVPEAFSDFMRAEIANIRIVLSGETQWTLDGVNYEFSAGDAFLCGPTFMASPVRFSDDFHVFGMAVTPLGWAHMFDISSGAMADQAGMLEGFIPQDSRSLITAIKTCSDNDRAKFADDFLSALIRPREDIPITHVQAITDWLVDPEPTELPDLLDHIELSHRQVDRLCREYFGASPKKLHRKFRALHSANRLTWKDLTDWRDIALTSYYDQSHFIREFKTFNGRTPSEFIKGAHILVRLTLKERLQINHESPFSLVG